MHFINRKSIAKSFIVFIVVFIFSSYGCGLSLHKNTITESTEEPMSTPDKVYTTDLNTLGLTVDEEGTILLAGKPFYGFGVNSFTMLIRFIEGADETMYKDQFEILKKYNIPFVRINFGGYWPDYYQKYDEKPEFIYECMEKVLKCAEEANIGLVCSLLWYDGAIPHHVGEKRSDMGNVNSKTVKYATDYIKDIVMRFKDSPAIWAWEIGNEYNLGADLCDETFASRLPNGPCTPVKPSGFDFYTSEELSVFYTAIGNAIRSVDPHRMISSGNGDMRNSSKALMNAANNMNKETHLWTESWDVDTVADFYEMCAHFTPDPIDTLSFHLQHAKQDSNGKASFEIMLKRFNGNMSSLNYFKEYVQAAKKAKKGLYFGEMGDMLWMESHNSAPEIFDNITDWIMNSGIQIASSWQFMNNDLKATDEGIDGKKLTILQNKNKIYTERGFADTITYWSNK